MRRNLPGRISQRWHASGAALDLVDEDATSEAILPALVAVAPASDYPVFVYWCGRGSTSVVLGYDGIKLDEPSRAR